MKILLIAPHFFPDEHIGASRWNRLSKYIIKDGHEIYVIASDLISNSIESDRSTMLSRVDYQNSRLDVLLSYFRKLKKNLPAEKERQSSLQNKVSKSRSLYNQLISYLGKILRFPGVYWWSSKSVIDKGVHLIETNEIDVIVATFPFSVSISSAYNISKKTKTPWIADMRDGWSSYYFGEYERGTFLYKVLRKVEKYYLRTASKVVTINKTLADSLCVSPEKIIIIPNVFDPEEKKVWQTKIDNKNKIIFSFAGSVHDNHCWEIFLEGLFEIKNTSNFDKIGVSYYGGYFNKIITKASKYDLPKNLIVNHGYLERENLMSELSQADILLVFGFKGSYGDSVTTGKIFDYIELEKPVLVFGPKTSELAKLVEKTGIGLVVSDLEESKRVLKNIILNKHVFEKSFSSKVDYNEVSKYSAIKAADFYTKIIRKIIE